MKTFLTSLALFSITLPGTAFGLEGGVVSWKQAPSVATGWYWMYDEGEPSPPFNDPSVPPLPQWSSIAGLSEASKMAPYNDRPYAFLLPDSFWYFGFFYEPGDTLYISPDGWLSFDWSIRVSGAPSPPSANPPVPSEDSPNQLIAGLWADYNTTTTIEPTIANRVWYLYDSGSKTFKVQWNEVKSGSAPTNIYTFQIWIQLGGQLLLDKYFDYCTGYFSRHFIHFLYYQSSAGWTADNAVTGIENQDGSLGIWYQGSITNGRVIRSGFKKIYKHDVRAREWLSPGDMVLRWSEVEPKIIVDNVGTEPEEFTVTVDIYDDDDTRVYHNLLGTQSLSPGESKTLVGPCWVPAEIGFEYEKIFYVTLLTDECRGNDTCRKLSYVGCDDTIGYNWKFGDAGGTFGLQNTRVGTFYAFDSGVLATGGRVYVESPGPTAENPRIEAWSSLNGCGQVAAGSNSRASALTKTFLSGWNYASFPGSGTWIPGADPGGVWAAISNSSGESPGPFKEYGQNVWPGPAPCFADDGPGRGGWWQGSTASNFHWGGYTGSYFTMPVELFTHLGFGEYPLPRRPDTSCIYQIPCDLAAYQILEPHVEYVEVGSPVIPQIAVANLGRQKEPALGSFRTRFFVVRTDLDEEDTVYRDSNMISSIGWLGDPADDPDTIVSTFAAWTPEGKCENWWFDQFAEYELIGLVWLGVVGPDESDHCPYNDTVRRNVKALFTHDCGVSNISTQPAIMQYYFYPPGTEFTITCDVENLGLSPEYNVILRCLIIDKAAYPDTLVYYHVDTLAFLDWRGNESGNPYTTSVTLPLWTTPSRNWFQIMCKAEIQEDGCARNDCRYTQVNLGVEEKLDVPEQFALEVISDLNSKGCKLLLAVPQTSKIKLEVFDLSGRSIKKIENGSLIPGRYTRKWDGKDNTGRYCPAGIYLVRMEAEDFTASKKIVVLK